MDLKELVTNWKMLKVQENKLKEVKQQLREEIGKNLHQRKSTKELILDNDGENWQVSYQNKTTRSVDYVLLQEIVSSEDYDDIVSEKSSTALVIRKAAKPKKTTKKDYTTTAPVEKEIKIPNIELTSPKGKVN